ncbi:hypothetical protein ACP70R_046179 [Stipagrostis hirtigluma subsp. patula]
MATTGISKVDLRGLEPGGPGWEEARAAVTASVEALGAVLVAHGALGPDLRQALFGRAAPEFFALPPDAKRRLVSGPVHGYIGPRPKAPAYESARVWEAAADGGVVRSAADIIDGLELQAKDGTWLAVPADEPDTIAVVAGELLTVVTNGKVPASVHRVRTPSDRERFSAQFESRPKYGSSVRPLEELVGEGHPLQYTPCNFDEYVDFRFIGDGRKLTDPLKGFCGVAKDENLMAVNRRLFDSKVGLKRRWMLVSVVLLYRTLCLQL